MPLQPLWEGFQYKLHQTYGVEWMLLREKDSIKGGIVCDEMGLGKTIQMCGLIKESTSKKTLLFAPVAVLEQWKNTAARSSIRCFMLSDSKKSVHQPLSVLDNSTAALDPHLVGLRQGVRYMTNGLKARNRRDINIMLS